MVVHTCTRTPACGAAWLENYNREFISLPLPLAVGVSSADRLNEFDPPRVQHLIWPLRIEMEPEVCPSPGHTNLLQFVKVTEPAPIPLPHMALLKVGRNNPRPCGSGKKYKKCWGPLQRRLVAARWMRCSRRIFPCAQRNSRWGRRGHAPATRRRSYGEFLHCWAVTSSPIFSHVSEDREKEVKFGQSLHHSPSQKVPPTDRRI